MSLILDALKKSEQERRRDRGPDLQSIHQAVPTSPRRREMRWGWPLLIVVNAVAIGAWWWHQRDIDSNPVAEKKPQTVAPASSAPDIAKAESKPAPQISEPPQSNANANEFTRIEPRVSTAPKVDNTAPIQEFNELSPDLRNSLPAMTFSFHVYSSDPQNRTIIINNQRMREGDEISAGVVLQSITEDGVILAMDHHRIHIDVLTAFQ